MDVPLTVTQAIEGRDAMAKDLYVNREEEEKRREEERRGENPCVLCAVCALCCVSFAICMCAMCGVLCVAYNVLCVV